MYLTVYNTVRYKANPLACHLPTESNHYPAVHPTAAQLLTIRYRENSRGLTEIESKDARNQRGIPGSPDRAESLIMAFMRMVPQQTTVVWEENRQGYEISPI